MKRCRWILLGLMALLSASPVVAQELQVTGMKLLESDNEAMEKPQYDGNRNLLALLKVYTENVSDLVFASDFIIDGVPLEYKNGYYAVYITKRAKDMGSDMQIIKLYG